LPPLLPLLLFRLRKRLSCSAISATFDEAFVIREPALATPFPQDACPSFLQCSQPCWASITLPETAIYPHCKTLQLKRPGQENLSLYLRRSFTSEEGVHPALPSAFSSCCSLKCASLCTPAHSHYPRTCKLQDLHCSAFFDPAIGQFLSELHVPPNPLVSDLPASRIPSFLCQLCLESARVNNRLLAKKISANNFSNLRCHVCFFTYSPLLTM
jgi:hypothetical protein